MTVRTRNRLLVLLGILFLVPAGAVLVIKLAQGYLPDPSTLSLRPNGLLVATSEPEGAEVYLDGKLTTATDDTLNLSPSEYQVEIKEDGYHPWQKTLLVKQELVTKAEAYLFASFPELKPLTFTGASGPVISPDGHKVVFAVTDASADKNGLWVLELSDRPLGLNREPRQIIANTEDGRDFTQASYTWTPDSEQILVHFPEEKAPARFLLNASRLNEELELTEATPRLPALFREWEKAEELRKTAQVDKLPEKLTEIIQPATKDWLFSPDETKLMYTATASASIPEEIMPPLPSPNSQPENRSLEPGKIYVYDLKEDKNFLIIEANETEEVEAIAEPPTVDELLDQLLATAEPKRLQWFPTSKHLFLVQNGKMTILEYDNTNWTDVYTGSFENGFAFPFPGGQKLLTLSTLGSDSPPNLYAIGLR